MAISNRDLRSVQALLTQDLRTPEASELIGRTASVLSGGGSPTVVRTETIDRSTVMADVVYEFSGRESLATVFVLRRRAGVWRVDPRATLLALMRIR